VTFERQLLPELNFIAGFDGLLASFFRSDAVTIEQPPLTITQAGGLRNGLEVQVPPRAQRVVIRPNGYSELGKWFLGGAFGQAVWSPAPPLTLTLGARFDSYGGEADPEITPRVGIVYKPLESAAVKLLYGRSYLAPMWAHRRANDGNFLGNPDLDPETFEGYGLVFAYATPRLSGSVDFFYNRVSNLINAIEQCGSALYNYQNIGESLYMGAELEAKAQATTWLGLRGSYSFIIPGRDPPRPPPRDPADPRPTGSCPPEPEAPRLVAGGHIRDIPRHTFRYGLRLEPAAGLSLSVWGRATSWTLVEDMVENQRVLPNLLDERYTSLPPVALLDASVSYAWRQWQFQLVGTNLTNRYYERGGTEARPLARMGTSVEAVVTWRP